MYIHEAENMENNHSLLLSTSLIYRCTCKYYDKRLSKYNLGSGQLSFLLMIYEQEGITMNELAKQGVYDKGTVSKAIIKLEDEGYIISKVGLQDKRVRNLYTTQKTEDMIGDIYLLRSEWFQKLCGSFEEKELQQFISMQKKMMDNASLTMEDECDNLRVFGLQKTTLLDYPGKLACTVFTGGCNLKCPFCHNSDLVFLKEDSVEIEQEDVLAYLKKRKNVLEGVCISGGEPLLQNIEPFLRRIKGLGYDIKLDTNGCFFEKMKDLIEKELIDFVAIDIKNSKENYANTAGLKKLDLTSIEKSVAYLMQSHIPYEFRTTVVKELHQEKDLLDIAKWLKGCQKYSLQNFVDSDRVIQSGLHAYEKEELEAFREKILPYIDNVEIKGI